MKKLLFLQVVWRIVALLLAVPLFPLTWVIVRLIATPTNVKTTHHAQPDVQRYRLPRWLKWAETPDEHLPGGLYEPTVMKIYQRFGWVTCSIYWLLLRNVGQGILWPYGVLVGQVYRNTQADVNNPLIRKAIKQQTLIDYHLTPHYWGPFKFYYELVKDWYGDRSGVAHNDSKTVSYVAVLRLGIR